MRTELAQLEERLEGTLHVDTLHKSLYATDASVYRRLPLAVAYPKNSQDIIELISFASTNNTSLIPRTAGTSLAGQCVGEGVVVDVSKYFTKIGLIDVENRTVTLQPGVIRDELNSYLEQYGLFFGPNTSTSNRCMIGGMVGNNSSGTTSIQYGVTRDKVLSLKVLLSDGSEIVFSEISSEEFLAKTKLDTLEGQVYRTLNDNLSKKEVQEEIIKQFPKAEIHRRNTGYAIDSLLTNNIFGGNDTTINVCKLLTGSEGTLAFTTEITLQLDPLPPKYSALVIPQYKNLEACLHDVGVAMKHNLYT
ncbi:MAG: FAD-binding oxidoreductase, partial [Bacteroidetes bacterium]|nr:FAD-binding oxidoreductase [Bacteroidota bacterium]